MTSQRAWAQTAGATALPINLELVTVTETSVVVTWFSGDPTQVDSMGRLAPVPADSELLLGTSPDNVATVFHDTTPTPYHYVEITGLEPEQQYFFVARSGGVAALPASTLAISQSPPFTFTTPAPPPGRFLFAMALSNDMHMGETIAGLATTQQGVGLPPGVEQADGRPPYTRVMADALALEAAQRGAHLLVVNGDISSDSRVPELAEAKARLAGFDGEYLVTRGNHDRVHDEVDTFRSAFFGGGSTWFSRDAFGLRIVGLDTYDKSGDGSDNGSLSEPQWAFLRDELGRDKDRPTLVLGHHPVTAEATITTVPPVRFDMDPSQANQLEQLYAATPGVFLHHSGHTHRNKRTASPVAGGVVFQEGGAVKEYPGGFTLLRVFSGGYALNFYKFRSPLALEWSERSRPEYLGQAPLYYFGAMADRNGVFARDFSGLSAPAPPRPSAASAPEPVQRAVLAATGGSSAVAAAGAVGASVLALAARAGSRAGVPLQNGVASSSANSSSTAIAAPASAAGDKNAGRSGGPSSNS